MNLYSRTVRRKENLNRMYKKNNMKYKDKVVEVLVDGPSKKDDNVLSGYTKENKLVNFIGSAKQGDVVKVLIDNPMSFSLNGKQV